ncbi:MAG: hypothetical protein WC866_04740 [Patescibacteria group bacterium]|jgi:hypothetical protein
MLYVLQPILGLAAAMAFIAAAIWFITRPKKEQLVDGTRHPLPPSPFEPNKSTQFLDAFEQRLERHGFTIITTDGRGGEFITGEGAWFQEGPGRLTTLSMLFQRNESAQIGRCFAVPDEACLYCDGFGYWVTQVVQQRKADKTTSQVIESCFRCCSSCGKIVVSPWDCPPSALVGVGNILRWFEDQECLDPGGLKAERLVRLRAEHRRLCPELEAIEREIERLDGELRLRTDVEPFRGTPLQPDGETTSDKG